MKNETDFQLSSPNTVPYPWYGTVPYTFNNICHSLSLFPWLLVSFPFLSHFPPFYLSLLNFFYQKRNLLLRGKEKKKDDVTGGE
jgi:hypothetical protein